MIWFQCKQCGRTRGREESASGTLVFCECGHANRVPWTSTTPEPASPAAPPATEPFDELPPGVPRRRRAVAPSRRPDPTRCLNHSEKDREAQCTACNEAFCSACVVTLNGRTVCGPCKDFAVRMAQRPPQMSALALTSCAIGLLVAGPASFCLPLTAVAKGDQGGFNVAEATMVGIISLMFPIVPLVLGVVSLRYIETNPNLSGRPAALTGTIAGATGVLWCVIVYGAVLLKQVGG